MADALVLGASTFCVWVQVPSSAPIKSTPAGVLFIGAEDGGEHIPFRKGAVCALIKREGGTAKVPPSHIPFLAVVSGGSCVGLLGGRWRGAHGFLQRAGNCPDLTRRGHRKGSPFTHPLPCCCFGRGCVALGRERVAGPERNGFLFTKFTIFICKMSEDFTCGIY